MEGIGDGGHTIGIIAELLGKLLSRLREEMNVEAGVQVSNTSLNRKQRRKLERESAKLGVRMELPEEQCTVSSAWVNVWAPHFAVALLDDSAVRRKQTSAFCLPLLVTMVGGPRNRLDASMTCVALLEELKTRYESMIGSGLEWDGGTSQYETLYDRFLWAKLEVSHRTGLGLLHSLITFRTLECRSSVKRRLITWSRCQRPRRNSRTAWRNTFL